MDDDFDSPTFDAFDYELHLQEEERIDDSYRLALGELVQNAGWVEYSTQRLAWVVFGMQPPYALHLTGPMTFSQLARAITGVIREHYPNLNASFAEVFSRAASAMDRRNRFVHSTWMRFEDATDFPDELPPRGILSLRRFGSEPIPLETLQELASELIQSANAIGGLIDTLASARQTASADDE